MDISPTGVSRQHQTSLLPNMCPPSPPYQNIALNTFSDFDNGEMHCRNSLVCDIILTLRIRPNAKASQESESAAEQLPQRQIRIRDT